MKEPSAKQISDVMKALRRRGGSKPGLARAAALTPERRREIAIKAGQARGRQKVAEKEARLAREAQEKKQ